MTHPHQCTCKCGPCFIALHRKDTGNETFVQVSQIQSVEMASDGSALLVLASTSRGVSETYEQVVCALKNVGKCC